jgi:hypothetical protein
MKKKKINVDELVDLVAKAKRKRPKNWIDFLDDDAKEFMFKLRSKKNSGVPISPTRVVEKLEEHFGVRASDIQVRRFLSGALHAEEDFEEEKGSR